MWWAIVPRRSQHGGVLVEAATPAALMAAIDQNIGRTS